MSFADDLADFTAAEIQTILGCKRGTAYDWKDGRREPPEWQRPHWLRILRAGKGKATKAQQDAAQNRPPATSRSGKQARKRQGGV